MAIGSLGNILRIFGRSSANAETHDELYAEVLLTTLARASKADANIHPMEIETIQKIMQRETGQAYTEVEIRTASRSEVNESENLRKYLRGVQSRLNDENKTTILMALGDVIRSDTHINVLEIDFFNRVAESLGATPAQIAGLQAGDVD